MYDLVVIGAGPGGYVAAIKAAQLGMTVAIIEKENVGGTCLNRGCIPTKTMLHAAEIIEETKIGKGSGIHFEEMRIDFQQLYQRKNEVVSKLVDGIENLLKSNGVVTIFGTAEIIGEHEVRVGEEKLSAKNILIATGGKPIVPPIKGINLPQVLTSDGLLAEAPKFKQLVIVGGGVIGVEFASIFNAFGCEVSLVEASDRLLPNFDKELSKKMTLLLKKKGIAVHTKASVTEIQDQKGKLACFFKNNNGQEMSIACDNLLVATGRKASFTHLFAEHISCEANPQGLKVNPSFQTSIPSIYAIGDVVSGNMQLAHVASAQGVNAVLAMNKKEPEYDLSLASSCVYTSPELASVGIDEGFAKAEEIPVKIGKYNMAGNAKSMIVGNELGFIKVISHEQTGEVLGAQLMCERATDMVAQFAEMIHQKVTIQEALQVIYPHPTFSEGIGEALESSLGQAIHVAPARRK